MLHLLPMTRDGRDGPKAVPSLIVLALALSLVAVPASAQIQPATTAPDPGSVEPGRYHVVLSPWPVDVNGELRLAGRVSLAGNLLGPRIEACGERAEVSIELQMPLLHRIMSMYVGLSHDVPQTTERVGAILEVAGSSARRVVTRRLQGYAGGTEPPEEDAFLWLREGKDGELLATVGYTGPANFEYGFGRGLSSDVPFHMEWTFRLVHLHRFLSDHGFSETLRPSDRVRAIQSILCDDTAEEWVEMDAPRLATRLPSRDSVPSEVEAPVPYESVVSGDVGALTLEDVLDAADVLPAVEREALLDFYRRTSENYTTSRLYHPACIAIEYLHHARRSGEPVVADAAVRAQVPDGAYMACVSEDKVKGYARSRLPQLMRPGVAQTDEFTECVANDYWASVEGPMSRGVPSIKWHDNEFVESLSACRDEGGNP